MTRERARQRVGKGRRLESEAHQPNDESSRKRAVQLVHVAALLPALSLVSAYVVPRWLPCVHIEQHLSV